MKKLLLALFLILAMLLVLVPAAFAEEDYAVVTFHANGGWFWNNTEQDTYQPNYVPGSVVYGYDSYCYLGLNSSSHMALSGWYYDAACTQPAYSWNEQYTITGDADLYAGWTDGYDVTLNPGDGFYYGDSTRKMTIPMGNMVGNFEFPINPESMIFDHWELADGTVVDLLSYVPTRDVTLYAKYVRAYTVTYNANGGFFGNTVTTEIPYSVREGDYVYGYYYAPEHPDSHMAFTGWYLDADCTQFACEQNGSIMPSRDMTLYAGWAEGWIVTFDPGAGSINEWDQTSVTVPRGSAINYNPFPVSADQDYEFDYWELNGTKIEDVYVFVPEGDVTLHAHYVPLLSVTFDANGGCFEYDSELTRLEGRFPEGLQANVNMLVPRPTHSGERAAFNGWYSDAGCTELVAAPNGEITINKAMTLYAGWTDGYYVNFDANGGTGGPTRLLVAPGVEAWLTWAVPVREGWFFVGWADSADADAPQYYPREAIRTNADKTLYAVWKQPDFVLPNDLTEIGEEAFAGASFSFPALPVNTTKIDANAFANCWNMKYIYIPSYDLNVDPNVFGNATDLVLLGESYSLYQLASEYHHHFVPAVSSVS